MVAAVAPEASYGTTSVAAGPRELVIARQSSVVGLSPPEAAGFSPVGIVLVAHQPHGEKTASHVTLVARMAGEYGRSRDTGDVAAQLSSPVVLTGCAAGPRRLDSEIGRCCLLVVTS